MVAVLFTIQEVSYVPIEATTEFTTGDRHIYSRLVDANNHWRGMRHAMFSKKTVLVLASNSHYTTIVVEPSRRAIAYFDGLDQNPKQCPWEISLVKTLYEDESRRQGLQLHQDDWTIHYPANICNDSSLTRTTRSHKISRFISTVVFMRF